MTDPFSSYRSAPWQPAPPAPPTPPPSRLPNGSDAVLLALAVVIVILLIVGGVGAAVVPTAHSHASASSKVKTGRVTTTTTTTPASSSTTSPSGVAPGSPLSVPPVSVPSVNARPLTLSPSAISAIVIPAIVDVDTRLGYQHAIAAGTGMILSPTGLVMTNNHVVNGATTVSAVSIGTGHTYSARVVGVDPTIDVAVIQLIGASGLPTVSISGSAATPGDGVVAIGNAGGVGGAPSVTSGTVEALDQSIIANDPAEGTAEQLNGLIATSAGLQPGDSGGPLVNGKGEVVGMDTAASEANQTTTGVGFAIPIAQALAIAHQIEAGQASSTIRLGLPPFLGVEVMTGTATGGQVGAQISGTVAGGPADAAGLAINDVIVAVDGNTVSSSASLTTVLRQYVPGEAVTVTFVDSSGTSHSVRVVLGTGPAD